MSETIPADYIGNKDTTYCLAAFISNENQQKIAQLLNDLGGELPGLLWQMPQRAMHITLCEIFQSKPYEQDKETLFESFIKEYGSSLTKILSSRKKIDITFNILEASQQAVIVRGSDDGSFDEIRNTIMNNISLSLETKRPPAIIHSSIARYLTPAELDKVQDVVSKHKVSFTEQVTEFKLVKGLRVPLLDYAVLESYPLT